MRPAAEQHVGTRGETESPEVGEVIFADAADHAHARRWTFRQSQHSTVRPETRQVLIVSEGLHATAEADVPALLEALARDIATTWAAAPGAHDLDRNLPATGVLGAFRGLTGSIRKTVGHD